MADFDITISDGTSVEVVVTPSSASEAGAGVSDHGELTGLADDDHSQYHNDTRGDARYAPLSHVGAGGGVHASAAALGAAGFLTGTDKAKLDTIETGATADQSAAEVAFTAAGGIVATNVQAALQELDTETEKTANKDQNSGYAGLNSSGRVPIARLASGTPDGTKFVRDDGVLAVPGGSSGYRNLVTLGTDRSTSSTSLADVTGVSFSATSGVTYRFYALMIYDSNTTGGVVFSMNGPASPTMFAATLSWRNSSSTLITHNINAYNATNSSTASVNSGNICEVRGIITPSTTGTVVVRFASTTATTQTITVKAGSTLEWW